MERRAFDRIPTNLYIRFFHNNMLYSGIVTNLSKNGMRIDTGVYIPSHSKFNVLLIIKGMNVKVPVKVNRLITSGEVHRGMGVELSEQPQNYSGLVKSIRSSFFVLKTPRCEGL